MIDISIIIVNFNSFYLLTQVVESIEAHTTEITYEIIVVDNASTEGNVEELLKGNSHVKFILNSENRFYGPANNQGVLAAQGKYVLILNSDVIFLENSLKILIDYSESVKEKMLLICDILNEDMSKQFSVFSFPKLSIVFSESFFLHVLFRKSKWANPYYQNYAKSTIPFETETVQGCFMLLRREDMLALGGFDEDFIFYGEETDLCRRYKLKIGKVMFHPGTKVIHLGGQSTGKLNWFKFENLAISKILIYKKWYSGIYYAGIVMAQLLGYFNRFLLHTGLGILTFNKNKILKGWYFLKMVFVYPKGDFKAKI